MNREQRRLASITPAPPLVCSEKPMLADHLEEGLSQFCLSCDDF
jgi:hypothetical protein